jgi:hypothetical protein
MTVKYKKTTAATASYQGGSGQSASIDTAYLEAAAIRAHKVIDQISQFEVDIFSILGMRNLSAFIGELYAASLIKETGDQYRKNPHQDGYPDLLLMDASGHALYSRLEVSGQLREKGPFSPFPNGGIEVKATCGSVPTPDRCRKLGLAEKPDIGDQRIGVMTGYDWKAHHRQTNNLIGILWDFIGRVPRIVAVFFCPILEERHWGEIIQPKEGGGRTTSVSIMSREGVATMYRHWMLVIDDDPRYARFLNQHNKHTLL